MHPSKTSARTITKNMLYNGASLVAQTVKNPPALRETWVQSLGWEDPLEEDTATHSNIVVWRIPMDRGAWQATVHGVTRVGHDRAIKHSTAHAAYLNTNMALKCILRD